jgi:hypothetical protein
MFKRLSILTSIIIGLMAFAVPALAQDHAVPDGPFTTGTQEVKLEALHSYDELVKALAQLEKNSQGEVRLEVIGQSNLGRDIYMVSVGHGPDNVVIITQQHGGEPHGTETVLNLIQNLGSSGRPEFKQICEQLTVNIVPRVNPDGAEMWWRYNVDPDAPRPRGVALGYPELGRLNNETYGVYSSEGRGWDLNRFHFVDWTTSPMFSWFGDLYPENPGTESAIVAQTVANMDPSPLWFIDVHNQSSNIDPDGTLVYFSLDTAHMTNDWDTDLTYPVVQEAAKLLVIINDHTSQYQNVGLTRYAAPSAYAGRSRNQYMQVLDIPGILIEMRGVGQKSVGHINRLCYGNLFAVLNATVDGSLYDVDWTRISEIPNGTRYRKRLPASWYNEEAEVAVEEEEGEIEE